MRQDVDELVFGAERRAAVGPPAHRLEREITLDVDQPADHGQVFLVELAGALEQHLVRRRGLQPLRGGEIEDLRGLALREREGLLDVDTRAVLEGQARERVVRVRRRDDVHDVGFRARQQFGRVGVMFDVLAELFVDVFLLEEGIGHRDELRVGLQTDRRRMVHGHAAAAKNRDAE